MCDVDYAFEEETHSLGRKKILDNTALFTKFLEIASSELKCNCSQVLHSYS